MDNEFDGFSEPRENWSKLPHKLIEALPLISTIAELKVILYTLRHTWGYKEFDDWDAKAISTDEFQEGRKRRDGTRMDSGTGLTKPSVLDGLKRAVDDGFLVRFVDNTDLGRVVHFYRLRLANDEPGTIYAMPPGREGVTPWDTIDPGIKKAVYARFEGHCAYCERKSARWHYDHIVPSSKGGPSEIDNLALACPICNLTKHDKNPDEWGHPVIILENGERVIYTGWRVYLPPPVKTFDPPTGVKTFDQPGSKNFTRGGKRTFPRTEKETPDRNYRGESPQQIQLAPIPAALAELCKIKPELMTNGLAHEVQESTTLLAQAGVTPDQIRAFGAWWYAHDWRGKKGEVPKPKQVCETWGQFEEGGGLSIRLSSDQMTAYEEMRQQGRIS